VHPSPLFAPGFAVSAPVVQRLFGSGRDTTDKGRLILTLILDRFSDPPLCNRDVNSFISLLPAVGGDDRQWAPGHRWFTMQCLLTPITGDGSEHRGHNY
jgi:hypothetical protein